jgi:hypothetical protein
VTGSPVNRLTAPGKILSSPRPCVAVSGRPLAFGPSRSGGHRSLAEAPNVANPFSYTLGRETRPVRLPGPLIGSISRLTGSLQFGPNPASGRIPESNWRGSHVLGTGSTVTTHPAVEGDAHSWIWSASSRSLDRRTNVKESSSGCKKPNPLSVYIHFYSSSLHVSCSPLSVPRARQPGIPIRKRSREAASFFRIIRSVVRYALCGVFTRKPRRCADRPTAPPHRRGADR